MTTKLSKTDKLFNALTAGKKYTAAQITSRFKLVNPTATIARLRGEGAQIVCEDGKYQMRAA